MNTYYKTYAYYLKGSKLWDMPYHGIRYFSIVDILQKPNGKVRLNTNPVESVAGTKQAIAELKKYIQPEELFMSLPRMQTTSSSAFEPFYPINFFDFFPNIDLYDSSEPNGLYITQKDVDTPLNYYGHTIGEYLGEWYLFLNSKGINTSKALPLGKLFKATNTKIGGVGSFSFIGAEKLQDGQPTVDTKLYHCTFTISEDKEQFPLGGYSAFFEVKDYTNQTLINELQNMISTWSYETQSPNIFKPADQKSYCLLNVSYEDNSSKLQKETKMPLGLSTKRIATSMFDWLDGMGLEPSKDNENYKTRNHIFNRDKEYTSAPFWLVTTPKDFGSAKDYIKQYDKHYLYDTEDYTNYFNLANSKNLRLNFGVGGYSNNVSPFTYDVTTISGGYVVSDSSFPTTHSSVFLLYNLDEDGTIGKWTEIYVGGVDLVRGTYAKVFNGYMSSGLDYISDKQTPQALLKSYLYGLKVEVIGTITNPFGDASSKPGGGGGSHDGTSDIIDLPGLPPSTILSTGLIGLWNPSITQLNSISNILWTGDWAVQASKIFRNPMDVIQSLFVMPVTPVRGIDKPLSLAGYNTNVSVTPVASQYREIDMGSVKVNEYWGSFLDYAPYTKITMFLPYVGELQLNTNDVMGKTINVKYRIDFLNGTCLAIVLVNGDVLTQLEGVMKFDLPISSSDKNVISGVLKMTKGVVNMALGGGIASGIGGIAGGVGDMLIEDIKRNGDVTSNNGYMGVNYVFLRIMRPVTNIPESFAHDNGFASNITAKLGSLTGFTKVSEIDLTGINCTISEMDKIAQLLKEGVYI